MAPSVAKCQNKDFRLLKNHWISITVCDWLEKLSLAPNSLRVQINNLFSNLDSQCQSGIKSKSSNYHEDNSRWLSLNESFPENQGPTSAVFGPDQTVRFCPFLSFTQSTFLCDLSLFFSSGGINKRFPKS